MGEDKSLWGWKRYSQGSDGGSRPRDNETTHGETRGSTPLRGTWACASKCIHNCRSQNNSAKGKDPVVIPELSTKSLKASKDHVGTSNEKETSYDDLGRSSKGLIEIKALASKFLEA
ncbi:hypothetical protein MTR67_002850 [Solanum verrucosum]|uniref:Uncharacterized protein n=1 Tax=Solanum verrucosum TaxID=315347 RepID=A0AAF0PUH6_SOLVR|nr:hypothetical protein MTR67_002850 [Solanum verrucosum]